MQLPYTLLGELVLLGPALITLNQVGIGTFTELRFDGGKRRSLHAALDFFGSCPGVVLQVPKVITTSRHNLPPRLFGGRLTQANKTADRREGEEWIKSLNTKEILRNNC